MSPSPITPEQLAALPPELRALIGSIMEYYERQIAELKAELAKGQK